MPILDIVSSALGLGLKTYETLEAKKQAAKDASQLQRNLDAQKALLIEQQRAQQRSEQMALQQADAQAMQQMAMAQRTEGQRTIWVIVGLVGLAALAVTGGVIYKRRQRQTAENPRKRSRAWSI